MTEAEFQSQAIQLLKCCGWRVAHFRPAQTRTGRWITPVQADGKGFFDLVAIHQRRRLILLVELKTDAGRLTPEQQEWQDCAAPLNGQTVVVAVWRPRDWDAIQKLIVGG